MTCEILCNLMLGNAAGVYFPSQWTQYIAPTAVNSIQYAQLDHIDNSPSPLHLSSGRLSSLASLSKFTFPVSGAGSRGILLAFVINLGP